MTPPHVAPDGLYALHSDAGVFWSSANIGEALPGVVTPLGWSVWGPSIELGMRDTFARMGALETDRVVEPDDPSERMCSLFYGRGALSVSFLCRMGERLPGTSPGAIAEQLLGYVPDSLPMQSTLSRMPVIAGRMPVALALIRRQVYAGTAHIHDWWTGWIRQIDTLDTAGCKRALDDARRKQIEMTKIQARGVFVGVQASYDQLLALMEKADLNPESRNALMAGQGSHAETEIIADLWDLGREKLTLEVFNERHGYHGPGEGQLANKMWREDPTPVLKLAEQYAQRDESEHPARTAELRVRERIEAEKRLLAKIPSWQKPVAHVVLKMAVARIPLRGVAKEALIRALDVTRAAARRMGGLYVEQGLLNEVDDALYFTADELMAGLSDGAAETAASRRALRLELMEWDIPQHWQGTPEPFEVASVAGGDATSVTGNAVSGGVVEGVVRLVHDPAIADVDPGDILVCPTTDPSWASVLFLCGALVVDIGGPLSHAAVVAREIGIPCVNGTNNGTAVLGDGDRVRVDGDAGTVEVLERA